MEINILTEGDVTVVELTGELDAGTAAGVQQQVLPTAGAGRRLLLDMSGVSFMSSAGLRMLLAIHRQVSAAGGRIVLVGLSEELRDTMMMTGFLNFFATHDTRDAGIAALAQ